jgi:hypothetical protein
MFDMYSVAIYIVSTELNIYSCMPVIRGVRCGAYSASDALNYATTKNYKQNKTTNIFYYRKRV